MNIYIPISLLWFSLGAYLSGYIAFLIYIKDDMINSENFNLYEYVRYFLLCLFYPVYLIILLGFWLFSKN